LQTERSTSDPIMPDIADIRGSIAHEAGLTFGLSNVRSDGQADPQPPLYNPTVLDAITFRPGYENRFFSNKPLTLTGWTDTSNGPEFDGTVPSYVPPELGFPISLKTQNAYQTLKTILGPRPADDVSNVADRSLVDKAYANGPTIDLSKQTEFSRWLTRDGDYNVYDFTPQYSGMYSQRITIQPYINNNVQSWYMLLYDSETQHLVGYSQQGAAEKTGFQLQATGRSYELVIGTDYFVPTVPNQYLLTIQTVFTPPKPPVRSPQSWLPFDGYAPAPNDPTRSLAPRNPLGSANTTVFVSPGILDSFDSTPPQTVNVRQGQSKSSSALGRVSL
jgi:hypothetical protein